jgi:ubiquinone/menaquinone biosynthesis C-methylase UbiE
LYEQSKAVKRRFNDGAFHSKYFVGDGVDIGGGPDPLGQYARVFSLMLSAQTWDLEDGDAQKMGGVQDGRYDFLASSHCLEHMVDPREALSNWIRVVKSGGHLVITVPDEDMYEGGVWPSQFNDDHKHTFTIFKSDSWSPVSVNVLDLFRDFADQMTCERITLLNDFYRSLPKDRRFDQTMTPNAECAIEFIGRKI